MEGKPYTTFRVERARNGVIVEVTPSDFPGDEEQFVYQEPEYAEDLQEKEAWAGFLRILTEHYGPLASRYGHHEILVDIRPGRKCEFKEDLRWFLKETFGEVTEEQLASADEALSRLMSPWTDTTGGNRVDPPEPGSVIEPWKERE